MPRSPPTVADECILDILEFAENAIEKRRDLTSGKIIDALDDKAAVEFDDLLDVAVLLVQASDAERSAESMIAGGGVRTPPKGTLICASIGRHFDGNMLRNEPPGFNTRWISA